MTVHIDFQPHTEAWINSEARHRGLMPADIVRRVVEEHASTAAILPTYKTPEERIRAMDALAEAWSDIPLVPDSAFDRENIYEDKL